MSRTWLILDGLQDPLLARELSQRWLAAGLRNAVDPAGQCGWIEAGSAANAVGPAVPADEQSKASDVTATTDEGANGAGHQAPPGRARAQNGPDFVISLAPPGTATADGGLDVVGTSSPRPAGRGLPELSATSTAEAVALAAAIARTFGIEVRDRVGETFKPDNDLPALREQMTREYRLRLAQAFVFGLPALLVHYLGPMLARGGGQSARGMIYPWLFEMILVGWALWTAGLPMIWQGGLSVRYLRATGDLLIFVIILASFVPSCIGVASLLFTSDPWFGVPTPPAPIAGAGGGPVTDMARNGGPAFHVAMMAVMLTLVQRWQLHASARRLSGRGRLMMPRCGRLVALWLAMMFVTMAVMGWHAGLAFGLLLPAMLSAGAVNRLSPGWSFSLPVLAFAPVLLLGPRAVEALGPAAHLRVEVAAGLVAIITVTMAIGWRSWKETAGSGDGV